MNTKIEDKLNEVLSGETLQNALGFMDFLNKNEITQSGQYEMHYRSECVCYIDTRNEKHSWIVWTAGNFSTEYKNFPLDNHTKEIAWAHANKCGNCEGTDCKPGKTKTIFGKEFTNICNGAEVDILFKNPDADELAGLMQLMEMRKFMIEKKGNE